MSLFFTTAPRGTARKNLQETLVDGVPAARANRLGTRTRTLIELHTVLGRFFCWGASAGPNNARSWARMQPGDIGLMYSDGRFLFAMRVHSKEHSPTFARSVWGTDEEGETWENAYFVDIAHIDVTREAVGRQLGYSDDWFPRGFSYVKEPVEDRLIDTFGSVQQWVETFTTDAFPAPPLARRDLQSPVPKSQSGVGIPWKRPTSLAELRRRGGPPQVNADATLRGVNAHRRIEADFSDFLRSQGREPLHPTSSDPNFDVAWRDPRLTIAEIKSLTRGNETRQLRTAIGEIIEFAARVGKESAETVRKVIVVEQEPSATHWTSTCKSADIDLVWPSRFEAALTSR